MGGSRAPSLPTHPPTPHPQCSRSRRWTGGRCGGSACTACAGVKRLGRSSCRCWTTASPPRSFGASWTARTTSRGARALPRRCFVCSPCCGPVGVGGGRAHGRCPPVPAPALELLAPTPCLSCPRPPPPRTHTPTPTRAHAHAGVRGTTLVLPPTPASHTLVLSWLRARASGRRARSTGPASTQVRARASFCADACVRACVHVFVSPQPQPTPPPGSVDRAPSPAARWPAARQRPTPHPSPRALCHATAAMERAGIKPWELSTVDNTQCGGAPLEAAVAELMPMR